MANEVRLIDANALTRQVAYLPSTQGYIKVWAVSEQGIKNAPTIDPESLRPKGRWNIIECDKENKRIFVECECGATFKLSMFDFGLCYNYCPNCGAKMEE